MSKKNRKAVLLSNGNLDMKVDAWLWDATFRTAINMRYIPAMARHMSHLSASYAYGLAVCAEDLLTGWHSAKWSWLTDPDPTELENRKIQMLALIGFCKSGAFSIQKHYERQRSIREPITASVN